MRWLPLLFVVTACGVDPPDFGAPSDVYPEAMPEAPAIGKGGDGSVMTSVRVVPVFFPGDPVEADVVGFLADYAASPYWSQQVGEYGVGALTVADPIELPDAAPQTSDLDALAALAANLA